MRALKRVGWQYGRVLGMLALAWCLVACTTTKTVALSPALPTTEEARCAAGGGTWDARNVVLPQGHCAKGTPAQCQASGGNWQRVCMMGTLACVQPYVDADKACRSGSDCQGRRCLQTAEARGQNPSNAQPQTGRCLPNNNPCFFGINLEDGRPVPTAVAD